ncbi:MAG: hypothetical protein HOP13_20080 [Alphaproteobacteria bacterium]|nr:hypothetical protein [Alphaproteobacteria bacterium]
MSKFRSHAQNGVLFVLVAVLMLAVVGIYEAKVAQTPHNLEGHSTTEGGMTANPPAAAPQ